MEPPVPAISVIVVNHDRAVLLDDCLRSIAVAAERLAPRIVELIVVDNASSDGSTALVRDRHPAAVLIELDHNSGFAPAVERGRAAAEAAWIALVNNDATVDPGALVALLRCAEADERVGSVAAQVRFESDRGRVNSAGIELDCLGVAADRLVGCPVEAAGEPADVFGASAAMALYRAAMLEQIGGFDASFFAYLEDVDVAWRARMAGWICRYEPSAIAYHRHSATAGHRSRLKHALVGRNRIRLLAKNASTGQLVRWGPAMLAYELAYVAYACAADRTVTPALGRLRGLREWRAYRRRGAATRRALRLARPLGLRAALRRRRTWQSASRVTAS